MQTDLMALLQQMGFMEHHKVANGERMKLNSKILSISVRKWNNYF